MIGYNYTVEAIVKMIERFKDKINYSIKRKKYFPKALVKISKPSTLNPKYEI